MSGFFFVVSCMTKLPFSLLTGSLFLRTGSLSHSGAFIKNRETPFVIPVRYAYKHPAMRKFLMAYTGR
jgi:hypothetical protein